MELVNELTGRKDVQLTLVTQPKFRLAFENQMVATLLDHLTIDDCDQPPPPILNLLKITYESATLEVSCDDDVLVNKATQFVVEVALVHTDSKVKPKKEPSKKRKVKKIRKMKKKSKKKKRKTSESDASGSGSGSESGSDKNKESEEDSDKGSDESKSDKGSDEDKSDAEDSDEKDGSEAEEEDSEADSEENEDKKDKKDKSKRKKSKKKEETEIEQVMEEVPSIDLFTPTSTSVPMTTTSVPMTTTPGESTKKGDSPGPSEASGDKEKDKDKEKDRDTEKDVDRKVDSKDVDMSKLEWEESNKVDIPEKYLDPARYKAFRKYECTVKQLLDVSDYAVRARAMNSSGWGDWCVPQTFSTKKLVIDSKILKANEKKKLISWLPSKDRKKRWKLMFRGSKHGFTGAQFHAKCDNKGGPTVCIIESSMNHVFGGYTTIPWTSSNNYASDTNSFIFLVRASKNTSPRSGKWKVTQTQYSVYHGSSYGPAFGGGYDFYLANGCNTNNSSYANAGHSYACPKNNALLAGQYNFMVKDFELFILTK